MADFKITSQSHSKVTGLGELRSGDHAATYSAILKVTTGGYVPDGVALRRRIDATMFTADVPEDELATLEADDQVESVAISERLDIIE